MNRRNLLKFSGAGAAVAAAGTLTAPRLFGQVYIPPANITQYMATLASVYNSGVFTSVSLGEAQQALINISIIMQEEGSNRALAPQFAKAPGPYLNSPQQQSLTQVLLKNGVSVPPSTVQATFGTPPPSDVLANVASTGASGTVVLLANLLGEFAGDLKEGEVLPFHRILERRDPQAYAGGGNPYGCAKALGFLQGVAAVGSALGVLGSATTCSVFCGLLSATVGLGGILGGFVYAHQCAV